MAAKHTRSSLTKGKTEDCDSCICCWPAGACLRNQETTTWINRCLQMKLKTIYKTYFKFVDHLILDRLAKLPGIASSPVPIFCTAANRQTSSRWSALDFHWFPGSGRPSFPAAANYRPGRFSATPPTAASRQGCPALAIPVNTASNSARRLHPRQQAAPQDCLPNKW